MPHRPKKPCAYPGCPELTDERFCDAHAKQNAREYNLYRRAPETNKQYGGAWRKIRSRYISAHPLCEQCQKNERLTPAQEVHHIVPLSDGGSHNENNLMALCSSCHSGITMTENNRRRG